MFVRATIVEGVDPAGLLVPEQGIGHDEKGQPTALVVNGKGAVELRQLQVSQTVANQWLVTSGLRPGDRVIVEGTQSAEPGAQVHAVPADNVR
jgi:membrane fusion protein (multidrug efflux system)